MAWDKDILIIPKNTSDLDEFLDLDILPIDQIKTTKYGENAYETRKTFWKENQTFIDAWGLPIITDITGYTGSNPFINNFNITKDPEVSRWYIDEFIEVDVNSIKRATMTYVLNQGQKDYLRNFTSSPIEVNTKVIRKEYFDKVGIEIPKIPDFDIFFPFRISDPAYKFTEVVQNNPDKTILITDPNDSYTENYSNVIKKRFTKREYYGIIYYYKPTIIYNENPEKIFHPGLADFIYFGCDIVCPYNLPTLEDILI
jgi:hypothetical protein